MGYNNRLNKSKINFLLLFIVLIVKLILYL